MSHESMYNTALPWAAILIFAVASAIALLILFAGWKSLRSRRLPEKATPALFEPARPDLVAATSGPDSETIERFLAAMKAENAKDQ